MAQRFLIQPRVGLVYRYWVGALAIIFFVSFAELNYRSIYLLGNFEVVNALQLLLLLCSLAVYPLLCRYYRRQLPSVFTIDVERNVYLAEQQYEINVSSLYFLGWIFLVLNRPLSKQKQLILLAKDSLTPEELSRLNRVINRVF